MYAEEIRIEKLKAENKKLREKIKELEAQISNYGWDMQNLRDDLNRLDERTW